MTCAAGLRECDRGERQVGNLHWSIRWTPTEISVKLSLSGGLTMTIRAAARPVLLGLVFMLFSAQSFAHTGQGVGGFASGFTHPIFGWDHVIAMVAVGLWGAFLGWPAIWILPVTFPLVMALGGALGVEGVPIPGIETGIALSGLVLGLMVAFAVRAPIAVAMVLVGIFAIFHGHAHGAELPESANPFAYALGFVISTGLLHLAGIGIGFLTLAPGGKVVVRAIGGVIALGGAAFLFGYA